MSPAAAGGSPASWGRRVLDTVKEEGTKKVAWLALALVGAVVAAWVGVKNPEALPEWLVSRVKIHRAAPTVGPTFTVMVADLDGEGGAAQAQQLLEVLGATRGLTAYRYPEVLRIAGPGAYADQLAAAERTGQRWLEQKRADVLVWGSVAGSKLRLRFLPRVGQGSTAYGVPTEVQLDTAFRKARGAQLEALTLATVAPLADSTGRYLVTLLKPVAARLDSLLQDTTVLTGPQRASVQVAYGFAANTIGEQAGDASWTERAVRAYRAALLEYPRARPA